MSCRELIDSLRSAAGERTRQLWKDAEAEAERFRAEAGRRIDRLRTEAAGKQAEMVRDLLARGLSEARNRARVLKLSAEQDISERLYRAAVSCLPAFRSGPYAAVFTKLARELPLLDWKIIRVHPEDVSMVRTHFPGAEIVADSAITGGLDASTRDGAIRIINTFEKRLERAWGEILPVLIGDIYREISDGTPSSPAGPGVSGRIPAVEDQREKVPADR